MRLLFTLVRNAFALVSVLLGLPWRMFQARARPSYVRFRLKGDPPYRRGRLPRWPFRRPDPSTVTSLHELRLEVERLASDGPVEGVIFEVEGFTGGPAKRELIIELMGALRKAGKRVVGYAVSADSGEYELLCACDWVGLAPGGRLELVGFAAEAFALGAGLRKLGVRAHFVRRGEFKTAPELFTHDEASEIQRRTLETILEERYQALLQRIATGRRLSLEQVVEKLDRGPFSARRALSEGLLDALVSKVDLPLRLSSLAPSAPKPKVGSFPQYASSQLLPPFRFRSFRALRRVSVVPLQGMIVHGSGGGSPFGPAVAGSEAATRALRSAASDPRTQAVVLYVNSPGGSALASELILEEVKRTAGKKPVVAYFDKVAASGGYMAALGAKEIWAAPQAIVGSIGVFAGKFDFSGLMSRLGVHATVLTRGANAAIFSSVRGFTEHERKALEADVEETYQSFLEHVATSRGRPTEEIHQKAEGRIYSGTAALEAGLIDRLGSFEEVGRRALELADIRTREFEVVMHGPRRRALPWIRLLERTQAERIFALWHPWWTADGIDFHATTP